VGINERNKYITTGAFVHLFSDNTLQVIVTGIHWLLLMNIFSWVNNSTSVPPCIRYLIEPFVQKGLNVHTFIANVPEAGRVTSFTAPIQFSSIVQKMGSFRRPLHIEPPSLTRETEKQLYKNSQLPHLITPFWQLRQFPVQLSEANKQEIKNIPRATSDGIFVFWVKSETSSLRRGRATFL
jgi:hypothetical protein